MLWESVRQLPSLPYESRRLVAAFVNADQDVEATAITLNEDFFDLIIKLTDPLTAAWINMINALKSSERRERALRSLDSALTSELNAGAVRRTASRMLRHLELTKPAHATNRAKSHHHACAHDNDDRDAKAAQTKATNSLQTEVTTTDETNRPTPGISAASAPHREGATDTLDDPLEATPRSPQPPAPLHNPTYPPTLSFPLLQLQNAQSVINALTAGANANRTAACRRGSVDEVSAPGKLIATGDLHDNPVNFSKLVKQAGMTLNEPGINDGDTAGDFQSNPNVAHLTLHEIIHSDRLVNGMDMSYRALARVADLKARYPEHVHTLLGNHELAQLMNAGVLKDGVRCVDVYNDAVDFVFGEDAPAVKAASDDFIKSMPIALEIHTPRGTILCAHSVPPAAAMGRFDANILKRVLNDDDYQPRTGSAYLMTWGRGYDAEGLEDLVERWGVYLFLLGHEKAEDGVKFVPPNAIILASDHDRGTFLPLDLSNPPSPEEAMRRVVWLSSV